MPSVAARRVPPRTVLPESPRRHRVIAGKGVVVRQPERRVQTLGPTGEAPAARSADGDAEACLPSDRLAGAVTAPQVADSGARAHWRRRRRPDRHLVSGASPRRPCAPPHPNRCDALLDQRPRRVDAHVPLPAVRPVATRPLQIGLVDPCSVDPYCADRYRADRYRADPYCADLYCDSPCGDCCRCQNADPNQRGAVGDPCGVGADSASPGQARPQARRTPAADTTGVRGSGGDLLSQGNCPQVPSALAGLTSVFGMGTGVALPP